MKDKRGLSGVVSVLILVLLVIVLISVVWVTVNNLVNDKINQAQSCFGILDSVSINSQFTCYDSSTYDVHVSLNIGDIDLDKVLISVVDSSTKASKSFELTNQLSNVAGLSAYPSGTQVVLPGKNSGRTYIATGFSGKPSSIEIAPVVGGKTCEASDSEYDIPDCAILAS